ncbi:MAG: hypothetical protein KGD63_03615 [Candidatus Lokiarchaeota archaeon]|nr:hypothetical protein [Candidatus Lokiarchaeota archaeon]
MTDEKKERTPIYISKNDIERAYKKVEEYQKLIRKGKTSVQIFKDMLKLIQIEK